MQYIIKIRMSSINSEDFYRTILGINFAPVVEFNPSVEKISHLNCTSSNKELLEIDLTDTHEFSAYIDSQLALTKSKFLIGGYNENRALYKRSALFDGVNAEPRTIHLGIDIWGPHGTPVYAPLEGIVHSFAYNNHFGDYGATLILKHSINDLVFHSLYGHICLNDISNVKAGQKIYGSQRIARFGNIHENGHWPPHLHFQLIIDLGDSSGDYPGVCSEADRNGFLANCPDPDCILNLNQFTLT